MTAVPRRASESRELDDLTIARAVRGDEAAFRALVERYERPVIALVWRMLAARGDATLLDDLVQETFVQVHHSLPRFSPAGAARLSTWILTIATRVVLRQLRRRRLSLVPLVGRALAIAAPDRSDAGILGAGIARALERLAPEQRALVLLRDVHELDYQELATVFAIEVGTVKSRLSRARARLRAYLEDEEERR